MNFETLQKDMVAAMKAKDKARKETISSLVSAVKKLAIDEGKRDNIPDELVDRAIIKELKTAKEQLDTCPDNRTDLKEEYSFRVNVITEYAPKMMSEDEVKEYITSNFAEIVATKNKGMIMKSVMAELKGKADGKIINNVVAGLCK
ncbi:MAG: GatB/YqeY domain-containing protein [Lachnospiraceae bacterium]